MFSIAARVSRPYASKFGRSASRLLVAKDIGARSLHSEQLKESYDNLLVSTYPVSEDSDKQVALMQLNRPKALNALSDAVLDDVLHASHVLDNDPSVRCMILTGSQKAFAAGADISEMQSRSFEEAYGSDMFGKLL